MEESSGKGLIIKFILGFFGIYQDLEEFYLCISYQILMAIAVSINEYLFEIMLQ